MVGPRRTQAKRSSSRVRFDESGKFILQKTIAKPKPSENDKLNAELKANSHILTKYNFRGKTDHFSWVAKSKNFLSDNQDNVITYDIHETITHFSPNLNDIVKKMEKRRGQKISFYNTPEKIWYDTSLKMWVVEEYCYG